MHHHVGRLFAALLLTTFAVAGCEPMFDSMDFERQDAPIFRAKSLTTVADPGSPAKLSIIAWNVKYGAKRIPFWFDCWGDRSQMSEAEVKANMADIYALINELDPDVLMTEEIEVNSRRSAYYDMVQGILDNTKLNWASYHQSWNSRYIASEGLGRMDLGNAIFSKHPIKKAETIRQADRTDQGALTQAFYLRRSFGRAEIELPTSKRFAAYVVHTEAYDVDGTTQTPTNHTHEEVTKPTLPGGRGGDFNELPPTAVKKEGFDDERETAVCSEDFVQPPYTPEAMKPFYDDFSPWITLDRYGKTEAEQKRYFTHTVLGPADKNEHGNPGYWNRTLDYLFAGKNAKWVAGSTDVVQEAGQKVGGPTGLGPVMKANAMELSDHAPVIGTWEFTP